MYRGVAYEPIIVVTAYGYANATRERGEMKATARGCVTSDFNRGTVPTLYFINRSPAMLMLTNTVFSRAVRH